MRIESGSMEMAARHFAGQSMLLEQHVRVQSGNAAAPREEVTLSAPGRAAAKRGSDGNSDDPKLQLLRQLIEYLTGRPVRVMSADDLAPPPSDPTPSGSPNAAPGPSIDVSIHGESVQVEQLDFAASGTVRTADGKEISFDLQWSAAWSHRESVDLSFHAGAAPQAKDPLMFDFAGTADQLSDQRFTFDIDSDGTADALPSPSAGSAFLVFDRNGDGVVNDGSELFGPTTGNGFGELAQLDGDGNGWIDEGDAAWGMLGVWSPGDGNRAQSLADARVGALATQAVVSPFTLRGEGGDLGAIRSSGVYLNEDGRAGALQQVDLFI
ncbi:MAG: hypothetical protein U1F52_12435 [Burkholderiales bacterium]